MKRWLVVSVVALALAAVSCGGAPTVEHEGAPGVGTSPAPTASASPDGTGDPRCAVLPGLAPEGFALVRRRERPQADHVGLRLSYRAPDGRRLEYLLGIPGEVGEGLPLVDELELATGLRALLLGRDQAWILVWEDGPPCGQSAIIGNGFSEDAFLQLLNATGLLAGA